MALRVKVSSRISRESRARLTHEVAGFFQVGKKFVDVSRRLSREGAGDMYLIELFLALLVHRNLLKLIQHSTRLH